MPDLVKNTTDAVSDLDGDAAANLDAYGLDRYRRYKASLIADGTSSADMEMILRGFIWSELEAEEDDTDE